MDWTASLAELIWSKYELGDDARRPTLSQIIKAFDAILDDKQSVELTDEADGDMECSSLSRIIKTFHAGQAESAVLTGEMILARGVDIFCNHSFDPSNRDCPDPEKSVASLVTDLLDSGNPDAKKLIGFAAVREGYLALPLKQCPKHKRDFDKKRVLDTLDKGAPQVKKYETGFSPNFSYLEIANDYWSALDGESTILRALRECEAVHAKTENEKRHRDLETDRPNSAKSSGQQETETSSSASPDKTGELKRLLIPYILVATSLVAAAVILYFVIWPKQPELTIERPAQDAIHYGPKIEFRWNSITDLEHVELEIQKTAGENLKRKFPADPKSPNLILPFETFSANGLTGALSFKVSAQTVDGRTIETMDQRFAYYDTWVDYIRDTGRLVILHSNDEWNVFINRKNGEWSGTDVDLWNAISKELSDQTGRNIEVVLKSMPWDKLLNHAANNSDYDFVISQISRSSSRAEKFHLSAPYFNTSQVAVVHKDSDFNSTDDLVGATIVVREPSFSVEVAAKVLGVKILKRPSDILAMEELAQKKVDAWICDKDFAVDYQESYRLLEVSSDDYVVIAKEPVALEFINPLLEKLKPYVNSRHEVHLQQRDK